MQKRPNLSVLALVSFVASFAIARTFTTLSPKTVIETGGFHLHHFWYGIALLVVGGWLGISYVNERIDRLAVILFGAGGGLIGDEAGLLLYLSSESYWAGISYTLMIVFIASASILVLFNKYHDIILNEFREFLHGNASLYIGVFLAAFSVTFFLTDNIVIIAISSVFTVAAVILILAYFAERISMRRSENTVA